MDSRTKVRNAFRAMKELGIPPEKVKPVLKDVVKLYDKNWVHIEADNYRVLIDAIFEGNVAAGAEQPKSSPDTQAAAEPCLKLVNSQNEDEVEDEESEALVRPLKRLRHNKEGQSLSLQTCSNGDTRALLVRPNEEPGEPLPHKLNGLQPVARSPDSNAINSIVESQAGTNPSLGKRQEKQPKQKSSTAVLIENNDKPMTEDEPLLEAPLAICLPDLSSWGDSPSRDGTINGDLHPELSNTASSPKTASANEPKNDTLVTVSAHKAIDLASSPSGEVKISLSYNTSHENPNFQPPSFEAVIKSVEEKCLKSYKILDPNFSLRDIMKDMCQTYLELGSNSESEPRKRINVLPAIDLLNRFSAIDARGLCSRSVNDSEISHSNTDSPLLILPPTPPHCDEGNNLSLVSVPDTIRPVHQAVGDVAKGQEQVLIAVVNDICGSLPSSFYYLRQNMVFRDANLSISLDRIGDNDCHFCCLGDCLSSTTPCACSNGGEFGYTKDGSMKEELLNDFISLNCDQNKDCRFFCEECPLERVRSMNNNGSCKGHLVRKIVKECWVKCGCDKHCGNRVVQRGITRNLQVFMTPDGKGWGLRTLEDLPKGSFVCEYVGEILTVAELFKREKQSHPVFLDAGWSGKGVRKDEDALCLDYTHYGNVARFINHRCHDSNMVEVPVAVETPDCHYYHVAFFTTREVKAMEELTWDYGIDFDDIDNPIKAFQCLCGSTFCRNVNQC